MIRLEKVSKSFDDKAAVDSMDLTVPEGSVFASSAERRREDDDSQDDRTLVKPDSGAITVRA